MIWDQIGRIKFKSSKIYLNIRIMKTAGNRAVQRFVYIDTFRVLEENVTVSNLILLLFFFCFNFFFFKFYFIFKLYIIVLVLQISK